MKNTFLILSCLLFTFNAYSQEIIYFEDFTGQDGKGAFDSPPTIDTSGVDWSVDVTGADFVDHNDWFQVVDEIFETRDVDGECIWLSPIVNISNHSNVSFSIVVWEVGSMEAADFVKTEYRIDGGGWTTAANNGYLNDDFVDALVSQSGLTGDSLEIRVTVINNVGTEYHRFDSVKVEGTLIVPSINLSTISGNTSESGAVATFDVNLLTQPDSNVVLSITSANTAEDTVSPTVLTFTSSNYSTPQTVTLTGIDDSVVDGDVTTVITVEVDDNDSDFDYHGLSDTIHVINVDNEYPLVINEILADPNDDANGDGSASSSEDEFIEFVNIGPTDLDITDFTISDEAGVRHTFTTGTVIPAGGIITVFGGGTPTGIPGLVQVSFLGLNNAGDIITINDGNSDVIVVEYGTEGGDNQSLARSPDFTGAFVKHTTIATNPVSFSPGSLNDGNSSLPVELLFFTAETSDYWITLRWSTATEEHNAYFDIERSIDGIHFEKIGRVQGSGTSYNTQEYSFTDENPVGSTLYYRLKQVDYDGAFQYHNIVAVNFKRSSNDIDIFSVLGGHQIDVVLTTTSIETLEISIFDINGQLLKSLDYFNNYQRQTIDIRELQSGVYLLRAIVNGQVYSKSFVKF